MKKEDFDILFDEKGFPTELADRKIQAIPIISGDDDTEEHTNLPDVLPILTLSV